MSMYHQRQIAQLGEAETYRLQIQGEGTQTKWLTISADQLSRIAAILYEGDTTYEIQPEDVDVSHLVAFGRRWPVEDFIGVIFPGDVGKRVTRVPLEGGDILQVENDQQRAARLAR